MRSTRCRETTRSTATNANASSTAKRVLKRFKRDLERPVIVDETVHGVHGTARFLVRFEHDKTVAFALASLGVFDDVDAQDAAAVREQRVQVGLVRLTYAVHVDDMTLRGAGFAAATRVQMLLLRHGIY